MYREREIDGRSLRGAELEELAPAVRELPHHEVGLVPGRARQSLVSLLLVYCRVI